jgi:hypothetical protein
MLAMPPKPVVLDATPPAPVVLDATPPAPTKPPIPPAPTVMPPPPVGPPLVAPPVPAVTSSVPPVVAPPVVTVAELVPCVPPAPAVVRLPVVVDAVEPAEPGVSDENGSPPQAPIQATRRAPPAAILTRYFITHPIDENRREL